MIHILVPTDFSHDAYNALFFAAKMYKEEMCTFHLLHVYDDHSPMKKDFSDENSSKTLADFLSERASEFLRETCHRIVLDLDKNSLHDFKTTGCQGQLTKEVKRYVDDQAIDLVVMGNKGQTGAKELYFGGNTMDVVKTDLKRPVLCVPKQIDFVPLTKITFVTDFEEVDPKRLTHLAKLADLHKSEVHIVHILEKSNLDIRQAENKDKLLSIFRANPPIVHLPHNGRSKVGIIRDFLAKNGTQLLAMTYHQHFFIEKLFREPIILDLSNLIEIPFMILPDDD